MDPITIAIVSAIADSAGKKAFDETYDALKGLLKRKFGNGSEVVRAVDSVEAKPKSVGRQQTLEEELHAVKAHEDPEILHAAMLLRHRIKFTSGGGTQTVVGNYNALSDRGGFAQVNIVKQGE